MPIRKFRSVEEMKCDLWYEPGDPRLWRAIEGVWDFALSASGLRFPPGVYKHRTLEESDRLRADWERASIERRRITGK
jgi:hypothetical protein